MNIRDAVENLHREHDEEARLLGAFESALELAVTGDDEKRSLGLSELREIVKQSARIRGSSAHDSEALDSPAFLLVDGSERARLKDTLFHLERASYEFRKELAFATTFSTEELVGQGRRLAASIREQIAYEEELLREVEAELSGNSAGLRSRE